MNSSIRIPLTTTPEQLAKLTALQEAFAQVCNALTPLVRDTRCWNRVALHHMAYKKLRERFPDIGSQMVCNAIYSVSRVARLVYQSEGSPFSLAKLGDKPLPLLRFSGDCPVYFDRHTLSLKDGCLSMYTLDGRMKFQLNLQPEAEEAFHAQKLHEVILARQPGSSFAITFWFGGKSTESSAQTAPVSPSKSLESFDAKNPALFTSPSSATNPLSRFSLLGPTDPLSPLHQQANASESPADAGERGRTQHPDEPDLSPGQLIPPNVVPNYISLEAR